MSRIELFVSAAALFLADRYPWLQRCRRGERHGCVQSDSSELIKEAGAQYLVCVLSVADPLVAQLIHISLFDGPRFDSLLPVSVKAELNVNQGPNREKHECKQIEQRAAR